MLSVLVQVSLSSVRWLEILSFGTFLKGISSSSIARGIHSEMDRSIYQAQFQELNETHLRSNLTFIINDPISVNCTDNRHATGRITLSIEGIMCY